MTKVGFIGTGHIAVPMARLLARKGHRVTVSERNRDISAALAAELPSIQLADNQGVVDGSDVVFLCLRPHVWQDVVPGLSFRADQQVVSAMAGVSVADLGKACAPVSNISMTIPLGFLENGGCPLPVFPDGGPLAELMGPENLVLPVASEHALNQHFAASAMLSAVLGVMEEGADWLAGVTGDKASAEIYVNALITGFLRDVPKDGQARLAEFKWGLATEGTLNLQMVEGLRDAGAFAAVRDTLAAIGKRMEQG